MKSNHTIVVPGSTIGIVGGGQLGRMMALAAANLGYNIIVYSPEQEAPAAFVSMEHICAAYDNEEQLRAFAQKVDVITLEFENVPHSTLQILSDFVDVYPHWEVLRIAQNRIREKDFLNDNKVATTAYSSVNGLNDLELAIKQFGYPVILKTTEMGYDGKGQYKIDEYTNLSSLWKEAEQAASKHKIEWICEQYVPFAKEISIIVARNAQGDIVPYEPSDNVHKDGILRTSYAPAVITEELRHKAHEIAIRLVEVLEYVGVLAIEYFVTRDDELLVNEIAPRPHNSGHWTMDASITSQFEQHIRAVCGLPLGSVELLSKVEMHNLVGDEVHRWDKELLQPDVKLHLYGKKDVKSGRKMGHVNRLLIKS